MESSQAVATKTWQTAQKLRKLLGNQLERLPKDGNSNIDMAQFEAIDGVLEKYRLVCVQTIFCDYDFAVAQRTEYNLWTAHTSINSEYRRILGRLKAPAHVEKRKLEKSYHNFLRIAQKFYKGYIQRLSARYNIPELKRVVEGIETQQLNPDEALQPSKETKTQVLKSCYSTLIRLGDLARYRAQARPKRPNYEPALTYYSLAHELAPGSGFAFHQIGMIHLDEGKHLDVVYDFYRACVVEEPHPMARQNLESEFKALQQSNSPSFRNISSGPYDAFSMWFVKLHALFYKGEVFSQHGELETEVMHRLRLACKSTDSGSVLLKMVFTNIAAYHTACTKLAEPDIKTNRAKFDACCLFRQYSLRLNIRFIQTFSEVLASELSEFINSHISLEEPESLTTPVFQNVLPSLRTYCLWVVAYRWDIMEAAKPFGSLVSTTIVGLTTLASLMLTKTFDGKLKRCPYLLPEDLESQGLRSLRREQIPADCQIYDYEGEADIEHDASVQEQGSVNNELPKKKPVILRKTRLQSQENSFSPLQENLGRLLDATCCVFFLANDPVVPIIAIVDNDGIRFAYQDTGESGVSAPLGPAGAAQEVSSSSQPCQIQPTPEINTVHEQYPAHDSDIAGPTLAFDNSDYDTEMDADMDQAKNTVLSVLAPFLKPPTPEPNYHRSSEESSYGMHTATANDVFAQLPAAQPSPTGSVKSPKFEPLPWNWMYTPTPRKAQEPTTINANKSAFANQASPACSPQTGLGVNGLEDPFATPGRGPRAGFTQQSMKTTVGSPPVAPGTEEAHRNRLLQSFASPNQHRTSPFSQWAQNSTRQPTQTVSPHTYQPAAESYPISSGTFSHPSSLYYGTPTNGAGFGMPGGAHFGRAPIDHGQLSQENGSSSSMRFQIDDATSSYDAAILKSAFYNK